MGGNSGNGGIVGFALLFASLFLDKFAGKVIRLGVGTGAISSCASPIGTSNALSFSGMGCSSAAGIPPNIKRTSIASLVSFDVAGVSKVFDPLSVDAGAGVSTVVVVGLFLHHIGLGKCVNLVKNFDDLYFSVAICSFDGCLLRSTSHFFLVVKEGHLHNPQGTFCSELQFGSCQMYRSQVVVAVTCLTCHT